MKIRDLIDALEQMEFDSDQGEDTKVSITVHSCEWNTSGFYIDKKIDDVTITFAQKDLVQIEIVLTENDLDDLQRMRKILNENELI